MFSALSQIAKHSVDLAEMVVEAEIFPAVLTCLKGNKNGLAPLFLVEIKRLLHSIDLCLFSLLT